jgi:hypothetical protein
VAEAEDVGAEKKGRTKARAKLRSVADRSEMAATIGEDAVAGEDDAAETANAYSGKAEAMAEAFNGADDEEQTKTEVKKVDLPEKDNVRELGGEQRIPDITLATAHRYVIRLVSGGG